MTTETEIRQYQLTDGEEVFAETAWFTPEEAEEANRNAQAVTDGNVWWEPVKWHPFDADYLMAVYNDRN